MIFIPTSILFFSHFNNISVLRSKHPLEGRQLIVNEALFAVFADKLVLNEPDSKLLIALSNCTVETILKSPGMTAINCDYTFETGIVGADTLFTRDFYEDLLEDIRLNLRSLLIGNPGVGKSLFQFYYLARIMNPKLFGPLPPDHNGCTAAPKVVIRQVGLKMTVYDIENRAAYLLPQASGSLLDCFNPSVTLYFYEPDLETKEPFLSGLPTLATVSPNVKRYHQFRKKVVVSLYMPTYTLDELQSAGKYLLLNGKVPKPMIPLYNEIEIADRYHEFGGIIRHVLASQISAFNDIRKLATKAINNCDAGKILSIDADVGDEGVSHFIMQMNITRSGPERFMEYTTEFVGEKSRRALEMKIAADSPIISA